MKLKRKYIYRLIGIIFAAFLVWRFVRPMNIFVVDESFERPMRVEVPEGLNSISALQCGKCHEEIYQEWSGSMHAKAWTDPYYQVDYAFDGYYQVCLNCHIPLENQQENLVLGFNDDEKFDPILKPNPNFDSKLQQEGVTCAVCHVKDGKIVGPFKTDNAPHAVIVDPEMSFGIKPCKKCHVVSGKRWDVFYRIPPCGTVAEIKESEIEIDCVGCHMPQVNRPVALGMKKRKGRKHIFGGGHRPEIVKKALSVAYKSERKGDRIKYIFTLTNIGTHHYLPTGTPDRHLTLELELVDNKGNILKKDVFTMKRYILWRPIILDLRDTRLPFNKPRDYTFEFNKDDITRPAILKVKVRYHLLDEARRKRIGYENKEPIAYPIYSRQIHVNKTRK